MGLETVTLGVSLAASRPRGAAPRRGGRGLPWERWSDERLLKLRLCDLRVRLRGSLLQEPIAEVRRELRARGLRLRPHFWLSDHFFCPDGIGGVALPFYLAHPRLIALEQAQMLEVEGGAREWCLRILRHELGHAIENAYALRRRRRRRQLFGSSSEPYPDFYTPRPRSRRFVANLEDWYGQSHPDEDFAETFAVWLTPGSDWRRRYAGWPALEKLEYVDRLMRQLAGREPPATPRTRVDPLAGLTQTLAEHYARKRRHYGVDQYESHDRDLRRLFSGGSEHAQGAAAWDFIARVGPEVRRQVRRWTGEYEYNVDRVLRELGERSRDLGLRLDRSDQEARHELVMLLAVKTLKRRFDGRHRLPL